jgi:hypothetical protein
MTNYDRWKLATPEYLEDTDEQDDGEAVDDEVELDLSGGG